MDIECSSPFGAISVAVSTGPFSFDSLVKAGADFVLEDLTQAKGLRLFYPDSLSR